MVGARGGKDSREWGKPPSVAQRAEWAGGGTKPKSRIPGPEGMMPRVLLVEPKPEHLKGERGEGKREGS